MSQMNVTKKIEVSAEHWDRLVAPSACLVMIMTVDGEGRSNAGSFGTCVRVLATIRRQGQTSTWPMTEIRISRAWVKQAR